MIKPHCRLVILFFNFILPKISAAVWCKVWSYPQNQVPRIENFGLTLCINSEKPSIILLIPRIHGNNTSEYQQQMHALQGVSTKELVRVRRLAQRQRAAVACARCRLSKTRCTEYRPCKKCARLNVEY